MHSDVYIFYNTITHISKVLTRDLIFVGMNEWTQFIASQYEPCTLTMNGSMNLPQAWL